MEVIVALSVFSIGLLGLAAMLPLLKTDLTHSDQRTRAVILAEETTEWLRGLAYEDSSLAAGEHNDANFGVDHYERNWRVSDDDPIAGVKRVAVSVDRVDQPAESATIIFLHAEAGR
jgi:Tfp pilus assembly protein PilV